MIFDDEINSVNEQREIIVGHSSYSRLLIVAFTERPSSIRLMSARLVTPKERDRYERSLF